MSVVHQYQPFPKPECTTTVEEMNAKLQARMKGNVHVGSGEPIVAVRLPDGAKPSPRPAPLEWDKPKTKDATGVKTKCGRYSCAKITQDGKVSYELWKLAPGAGWFRQLNKGLDNFLQVQKLAQIDADKGVP